jgi:isoleucyl-tRNA synthetase
MFSRLSSPVDLEEAVLKLWDEKRIFEQSLDKNDGKKTFVFYEGPPTANGLPHNGHVLTRVIKDVFPRYKTMRGFRVDRKAGWDTHGLPVEVEVEKALGIHGREAILEYGLDKFNQKCIDSVFTYTREWEELTKQVGYWVDMDGYVTYHRSFVESVWWALSRLLQRGLLYQSHKVVWWWPQGGTALSAGEVGTGYKEVDDPAITVRFTDLHDPNVHFLAWTTTPWTLPSNVALAIGEDVDYALCDDPDQPGHTLILAAARAESYGLTATRTVKGRELLGRRYVPLYDFGAPTGGDAFVVVAGDHVTTDAGTGIVHTAPAFGEDDMAVARKLGLGMLQWLNPDGKFPANTGFIAGKFCKDADKDIIQDLKTRGALFKRDTIRHPYPYCPRADNDPLIQYARPAWFIRTTDFVEQVLANNAATSWHPEHIRDGRFGDFLRNNVDWALSRERFWGTPLNIWCCEQCDHRVAPASAKEILARNPDAFDPSVNEHLQVHRPWIDRVTFACDRCSGTMHRVPEVIDCWFDSGCMPFAQWGWPHQGDERFKRAFPADFISEAIDQTRGWFYSLMMISTMVFDEQTCAEYGLGDVGFPRPFRNCMVMGHVCDADGRKESKSKGNYTSPNLVLRGHTRLTVLADPSLTPGTVGLKKDQVTSLDLAADERITVSHPSGGDRIQVKVVPAKVGPKDTVHLHPDDLARIGVTSGSMLSFAVPYDPPGADAFRWLFCAASPPWSNTRLSLRAIRDGQREFLIRLRNVVQFFSIYADIAHSKGAFDPTSARPRVATHVLDRWIEAQLAKTVQTVTAEMDAWRLFEACKAISTFVDDLSNWYVRRSRDRFWAEGDDSVDALWTLYTVLTTVARLIAPFVPFTAEGIWQSLVVEPGASGGRRLAQPASVHLADWPEAAPLTAEDRALSSDMAFVREVASLGLAARAASKVKVRQPLGEITLVLADPSVADRIAPHAGLLEDELNVRRVTCASDASVYVQFTIKADFKRLGARLGKDMKLVAGRLQSADALAVKRALDEGGFTVVTDDGRPIVVAADEVLVQVTPKEGYQASSGPIGVVVLDTRLDDDLRAEGLVREVVNRIQGLRKDLDLGYTDRIAVEIDAPTPLRDALARHAGYVERETLCVALRLDGAGADAAIDIDGHAVRIDVKRV